MLGADRGHQLAAPLDLEHVGAAQVSEADLGDGLADQRAVRVDQRLEAVLTRVLELLDRRLAVGQQPPGKNERIDETDHGQRQADPDQVEQSQVRLGVHLQQQAVHGEVRAGADQGAQPRQDHHVVHRQQQPRDRQAVARRPVLRDGDEHRHHGRVVDDRREQAARPHQLRLGGHQAARPAEDPLREPGDRPRLAQARDDDIERRDGHHAGAREPGQRLPRCHDADDRQDRPWPPAAPSRSAPVWIASTTRTAATMPRVTQTSQHWPLSPLPMA
jgi:hypothetical protein